MQIKANPVKLTQEQIRFYDENGYLVIPGLYSEAACDEIKRQAESVAAEDYAVFLNLHRTLPFFMEIAKDPVLLDIVKTVQRHRVVLLNDQYLYKKAGTPYAKQSWNPHQDNAYVKAPREAYMQLHIFLDRSEKENGGLIYYPGSHYEDILPFDYMPSWREEADKEGITHPGLKLVPPQKYKATDVIGPRGGICLQHGHIIHGSHPNLTQNRSRAQYSLAYLNEGAPFESGKTSPKIPIAVE